MFMSTILPIIALIVFLGVPMTPLFIAWHNIEVEYDERAEQRKKRIEERQKRIEELEKSIERLSSIY